MTSIVLYSAFFGERQTFNPDVFGGFVGCRRVLFTDRDDIALPGVEVIRDPLDGLDPARASRRAKLMPHRWFADADWSIWIDNKSRLLMDPAGIVAAVRAQSDAGFLAFRHFRRDCVYAEGKAVCENGLDDHRIVRERMRTYRAEGLPEHAGLIEGHFILRRHNDPDLVHFGERWFEHVLAYSRRDQISFPYLVWRLRLRFDYITALERAETVQLTVFDPRARAPAFPRRLRSYQAARALWHRLRGRRLRP